MPEVSVIVCTYNREVYIHETLEHLARQSVPYDAYEIIIVNNNSTDNTESIVQEFLKENPELPASYFLELNQGHTYARNRGIEESKGDILAFIDDDAFVDVDYVKEISGFFKTKEDATAIGGRIVPKYEVEEPKWMSRHLLPLVAALDKGSQVRKFQGSKFPIGANMAFRKEAFEKYGQFDVELGRRGSGLEGGDEKDMMYRLKRHHEAIYYVPGVKVDHIIPEKRLTMEYIRGLAHGVGTSEKKRLRGGGLGEIAHKIYSELIKVAGTIVLAVYHCLMLEFSKAMMLIRFRWWVTMGFFSKSSV